jgi:hypothetical protein
VAEAAGGSRGGWGTDSGGTRQQGEPHPADVLTLGRCTAIVAIVVDLAGELVERGDPAARRARERIATAAELPGMRAGRR